MKKLYLIFLIVLSNANAQAQRLVTSLNSNWTFVSEKNSSDTITVNLPHTWNNVDAFIDGGDYYRGVGIYFKTLFIPENWRGKSIFIRCEGANQLTTVLVNEKIAGKHLGGYTGFVFNLTPYVVYGSENQVEVVCDNSYNENIPPLSADFTFYGGIYRDVDLILVQALHIEVENAATGNIQIKTPFVDAEQARVQVQFHLKNETGTKAQTRVQLSIYDPNGNKVLSEIQEKKLDAKSKLAVEFDLKIEGPQLWSPETPVLYAVKVEIIDGKSNELTDVLTDKFGCRWFSVDPNKGFYLNGKQYRLMGVNRHQDFKGLGNALPNSIHEMDMKLIKSMGSNFIRIAHYPQDPDIYDWCDKLGIIAWSEIPIVNQITNTDTFANNCLQMQREQVLQNMNHPSVMMWGYMNEVFLRPPFNRTTSKEGKENYYKDVVDLARRLNVLTKLLDISRITVMALHGSQIYNETGIADIPDVVGWNLYMGWYGGELNQLGGFLDREHQNHPNRPMLISEYGPGTDVRIQTHHPQPWDFSEAYQLKNHMSYVDQVFEREFVLGMAAWNYADFASASRVDAIPDLNQKGLLTYDREPKDVFYYYQARLLKRPFVYIAGKNFEIQFADANSEGKGRLPIIIFANSENVHLKVDGVDVDDLPVNNGVANTTLRLTDGAHLLEASISGASYTRSFKMELSNKLFERLPFQPIRINVGSDCSFTDAISGEIWMADREYHPGLWGYVGGELYQKSKSRFQGTDQNILGTQNDPLYQTMRVGFQSYRFDVPEGNYKVTLLFAEPNATATKLVYDLENGESKTEEGKRVFSVFANGRKVISDLNLAESVGVNTACELAFEIITNGNIELKFESVHGKAVLSGIRLEQR
ncbi:MAG: glycoside hydrolase family 2 TIM barrel-domain containing protein [Prolixibacteraceae bacterium]